MSKTKFVVFPVDNDFKTVNVKNIALLEKEGIESVVTLNITDSYGNYLKFKSAYTYDKFNEEIHKTK